MNELNRINDQIEALTSDREEINAKLLELGKRKSAIETQLDIEKKVASFTPAERDALFQELRAQGISSAEAVGTPGG